jgi:hypothetical protein
MSCGRLVLSEFKSWMCTGLRAPNFESTLCGTAPGPPEAGNQVVCILKGAVQALVRCTENKC